MSTALEDAPAATSTATETATEEIAQVGTTGSTTDSQGAQAESTPPADDELEEFKAEVAKATGAEPTNTETESKPETETATPPGEPADKSGEEEESAALSQEKQVPDKLTDRPEWQKLTAIADKVGKVEGKEARALLRGFFKREYDLGQVIEKTKPAQEVYQEMLQSVGGNAQGFSNMRQLIKDFDADPAGSVPKLKILLDDAMKRAGMVLQSPELLTEHQQLEAQLRDGVIDQAAYEKRNSELLELEQVRTTSKRTQAQTQAERDRQQRQQSEKQRAEAAGAIDNAEAAWTDNKSKTDIDFAPVQKQFNRIARENAEILFKEINRIPTVKEINELLEKSLKQAKDEVAVFRPKPRARQAITGGSNGSSGNNRQQPSSELDEFRAEVEAAQKRHGR